jgi:uncharacterized phage protein (TIGR01671 family)
MREIKFRAWDKANKVYIVPTEKNGGNVINAWVDSESDVSIIEQFTGLLDKNGKEIYEGDILRISAKDKWEEVNYSAFEVFFHDNDCCDSHIGYQMGRMHNFGAIAGGFCGYQFKPETTAKFEVIGNIHE